MTFVPHETLEAGLPLTFVKEIVNFKQCSWSFFGLDVWCPCLKALLWDHAYRIQSRRNVPLHFELVLLTEHLRDPS